MSAVDTLSPVCVDVAREAPETLEVSDPRSGASETTPLTSAKPEGVRSSVAQEERWTFGLIAVFVVMLVAVGMQPAAGPQSARRRTSPYAVMDASAHVVSSTR